MVEEKPNELQLWDLAVFPFRPELVAVSERGLCVAAFSKPKTVCIAIMRPESPGEGRSNSASASYGFDFESKTFTLPQEPANPLLFVSDEGVAVLNCASSRTWAIAAVDGAKGLSAGVHDLPRACMNGSLSFFPVLSSHISSQFNSLSQLNNAPSPLCAFVQNATNPAQLTKVSTITLDRSAGVVASTKSLSSSNLLDTVCVVNEKVLAVQSTLITKTLGKSTYTSTTQVVWMCTRSKLFCIASTVSGSSGKSGSPWPSNPSLVSESLSEQESDLTSELLSGGKIAGSESRVLRFLESAHHESPSSAGDTVSGISGSASHTDQRRVGFLFWVTSKSLNVYSVHQSNDFKHVETTLRFVVCYSRYDPSSDRSFQVATVAAGQVPDHVVGREGEMTFPTPSGVALGVSFFSLPDRNKELTQRGIGAANKPGSPSSGAPSSFDGLSELLVVVSFSGSGSHVCLPISAMDPYSDLDREVEENVNSEVPRPAGPRYLVLGQVAHSPVDVSRKGSKTSRTLSQAFDSGLCLHRTIEAQLDRFGKEEYASEYVSGLTSSRLSEASIESVRWAFLMKDPQFSAVSLAIAHHKNFNSGSALGPNPHESEVTRAELISLFLRLLSLLRERKEEDEIESLLVSLQRRTSSVLSQLVLQASDTEGRQGRHKYPADSTDLTHRQPLTVSDLSYLAKVVIERSKSAQWVADFLRLILLMCNQSSSEGLVGSSLPGGTGLPALSYILECWKTIAPVLTQVMSLEEISAYFRLMSSIPELSQVPLMLACEANPKLFACFPPELVPDSNLTEGRNGEGVQSLETSTSTSCNAGSIEVGKKFMWKRLRWVSSEFWLAIAKRQRTPHETHQSSSHSVSLLNDALTTVKMLCHLDPDTVLSDLAECNTSKRNNKAYVLFIYSLTRLLKSADLSVTHVSEIPLDKGFLIQLSRRLFRSLFALCPELLSGPGHDMSEFDLPPAALVTEYSAFSDELTQAICLSGISSACHFLLSATIFSDLENEASRDLGHPASTGETKSGGRIISSSSRFRDCECLTCLLLSVFHKSSRPLADFPEGEVDFQPASTELSGSSSSNSLREQISASLLEQILVRGCMGDSSGETIQQRLQLLEQLQSEQDSRDWAKLVSVSSLVFACLFLCGLHAEIVLILSSQSGKRNFGQCAKLSGRSLTIICDQGMAREFELSHTVSVLSEAADSQDHFSTLAKQLNELRELGNELLEASGGASRGSGVGKEHLHHGTSTVFVLDANQKCDCCFSSLYESPFVAFPCAHAFHNRCLPDANNHQSQQAQQPHLPNSAPMQGCLFCSSAMIDLVATPFI